MLKLSLRRKIVVSYVAILFLFLSCMFPFASYTVKRIVTGTISERVSELIETIHNASDDEALVQKLKDQKSLIFFRVGLITDERKLLYDSYSKRLLGPGYNKKPAMNHPEVEQAFKEGVGFYEGDSKLLNQRFLYMAKTFDFHGKTYVLRAAFPNRFVDQMTNDFEVGFVTVSIAVLVLFSFVSWYIINKLISPIQKIITTIKPYQEGLVPRLPKIELGQINPYDEIGQLAATLNSLSAKIQHHIDTLKDFIGNASHELKTPITIIRGFAETLHDNANLPLNMYQNITHKIVQSCKRMADLIKDLLTLTDIENMSQARLLNCDLYELAKNCTLILQDLYPDASISLHKKDQEQMTLLGDPHLLEMAMMNLLENAAKYSTGPAKIDLKFTKEKGWITLKISDKGIGIPKADQAHIFERFYTVNKAHSRKLGGSGLGLSIVKTVIDKHAGIISLHSKPGEGTTFTIKLKQV